MGEFEDNIERLLRSNREQADAEAVRLAAQQDQEAEERRQAGLQSRHKAQQLKRELPTIIETSRRIADLAVQQGVAPLNDIEYARPRRVGLLQRQRGWIPEVVVQGWTLQKTIVESRPYRKTFISGEGYNTHSWKGPRTPQQHVRNLVLSTDKNLYLVDTYDRALTYGNAGGNQYVGTPLQGGNLEFDDQHSTLPKNPHHVTAQTPESFLAGLDPDKIKAALAALVAVNGIRG